MQRLDRLGWVVTQVYEIGGERVEIRSTSASFSAWLGDALASYRRPDDGEDDPYLSVVVDGGTGVAGGRRYHVLYRRTSSIVRTLDVGTLARAVLGELERLGLPTRDDLIHLDAAAATVGAANVVFPGYLVPFMADVGRRAERMGAMLPAHATLSVDPAGAVVPTEGMLGVPDRRIEELRRDFPSAASEDRFFVRQPLRPDGVLLLAHEADVDLRPISRAAALHRLATSAMNLPVVGPEALTAIGRSVSGAACYEASWGGPRRFLDDLVRVGAGDERATPSGGENLRSPLDDDRSSLP